MISIKKTIYHNMLKKEKFCIVMKIKFIDKKYDEIYNNTIKYRIFICSMCKTNNVFFIYIYFISLFFTIVKQITFIWLEAHTRVFFLNNFYCKTVPLKSVFLRMMFVEKHLGYERHHYVQDGSELVVFCG